MRLGPDEICPYSEECPYAEKGDKDNFCRGTIIRGSYFICEYANEVRKLFPREIRGISTEES